MITRTIIALVASSALAALALLSGVAPAPTAHGEHGGTPLAAHAGHAMAPVASELDFIAGMIPHHQEAVDSARELLSIAERRELRALAEAIIAEQSEEIATLQAWLGDWYPDVEPAPYTPMMRPLAGLSPEVAERVFLEDMIAHHAMALVMAQELLALDGVRAPVRQLAEGIIGSQAAEMAQMMRWLESWYGVVLLPAHRH